MTDLKAPLGTAGTLMLDELERIWWRHEPAPRRAARLLVADLPTGRLELSCNEAVDEVTATLDGERVGRVHDIALRRQGLMFDGAPGPKLKVGGRVGGLTWRMRGSKLRPLGRTRWFEVDLAGSPYSYCMKGFFQPLVRSATPDGDPVVMVGTSGIALTTKKVKQAELDDTKHTLNWFPQTTTAELVLSELLTMGMTTRDRSSAGRLASIRRQPPSVSRIVSTHEP